MVSRKFNQLFRQLQDRYHHVIAVIDEALSSENFRDRVWAVEQILKRTKKEGDTDDKASKAKTSASETQTVSSETGHQQAAFGDDLSTLDDDALMAKIRELLQ